MIGKSPFWFPQGIAQRIWEKQVDVNKGATQSAQSVCDLYSAGSQDGGRCQDSISYLCVSRVGKNVKDSWEIYDQEDKLFSLGVNKTQTQRWIEKFQLRDNQ